MINIWVGYDEQFKENIPVLLASIKQYATVDYQINFLKLNELHNLLYRDRDPLQTTDSAFTRWLVPYLSNYQGWNLYIDSDVMFRDDIAKLYNLKDEEKSVMVVKHPMYDYEDKKFNNNPQSLYDRKNWSSLILFNSDKCRHLNLDLVNLSSGLDLHQFKWLKDSNIGELPSKWNHLCNLMPYDEHASLVHWTLGGPWFKETINSDYSEEWLLYRQLYNP